MSYLTLEKRGEWIDSVNPMGYLAGCDICQEVCPYNTKPVKNSSDIEIASYLLLDEESLVSETEEEYNIRVKDSALSSVKFQDFKRNLKAVTQQF